jgi:hypothetical protein
MANTPNQITNAPSCPVRGELSRESNLSPKIEGLGARLNDAALAPVISECAKGLLYNKALMLSFHTLHDLKISIADRPVRKPELS